MRVINRPRASGKTHDLILLSHETGDTIVCHTRMAAEHVERMALKMGKDIPKPVRAGDIPRGAAPQIHDILVDDAEIYLKRLFPGRTIRAITITGEEVRE